MPTADEARAELARRELARRAAARDGSGMVGAVAGLGRARASTDFAPRPSPPRPQPERPVRGRQRAPTREQALAEDSGQAVNSGILQGLAGTGDALSYASGGASGLRDSGLLPSQLLERSGLNYTPQTTEGEYAQTIASMAPNAAVGGASLFARGASVVVPGITSETAGQMARAAGLDEGSEGFWRFVGALTGGAATGLRASRPTARPGPPRVNPAAPVNSRGIRAATATTTPAQMRAEAARLRAEGIEPTLVDVTDEAGRGVIRNAAARQTPARTKVQTRNDQLRVNALREAPARAANLTPGETRPAVDVLAAVRAARRSSAKTDYAAAGSERVRIEPFADELIDQRDALTAAAKTLRTNKNYDAAAEVDAMLARLDDGQPLFGEVSVAAADQIKQELLLGARNAAGGIGTKTSQAPGLTERGTNIDNYLAGESDAYRAARDNYAASSQRMEGLERGNILSMTGSDGIAAIRAMTPAGREGAKVAVRQQIQDMFTGATNADTPLRRLALEDDMRAILSELFSPQEADALARYAEVARQRLNRMAYVSPNTGPQSANRLMDGVADVADEAVTLGANVVTGNKLGLVRGVIRWARESGMSDADAQLLAEAAIDPARLDGIIASREAKANPQLMAALKQIAARGAPVAALSAATTSQAQARPGPPRR